MVPSLWRLAMKTWKGLARPPEGWLLVREIAAEAGVDRRTVLSWIATGKLRALPVFLIASKRQGARLRRPQFIIARSDYKAFRKANPRPFAPGNTHGFPLLKLTALARAYLETRKEWE